MPDLNAILADVGTFLVQSSASEPLTVENFRKSEHIYGNMQAVLEASADDRALVEKTKQTAELAVQKAVTSRAAELGVDLNAATDSITKLLGDINAANKNLDAAVQEVVKKRDVNPFEHPLDFIVNAITLPFSEDKLVSAAAVAQSKAMQLQSVNQAINSTTQIYNSLKESQTAASIEASSRIAAVDAQVVAYKAQLEGLKYNTEAVNFAQNATKERLALMFQAKSAANAEKQLDLALKNFKLDEQRFDFSQEQKKIESEAKQEEKAIDDLMLEKINVSRASFGLPQLTGPEAKSAVKFLKSGASEELAYHYRNGDRIKATGVPFIGSSPAESLRALKTIPQNLDEYVKGTLSLLTEAEQALGASKAVDRKDKAAVDNFINEHVKQNVATQYQTVTPGNLFDIGDLRSFTGLSDIKNLGITQKLLAPAIAAGQPLDNPKLVMSLASKAILDGKLTTSEAQELATIYQKGVLLNQASRRFLSLGVNLPNDGKNYFARIPDVGIVDMTNPTAIGRALSKSLVSPMLRAQHNKMKAKPYVAPDSDNFRWPDRQDLQLGPKLTYPRSVNSQEVYGR